MIINDYLLNLYGIVKESVVDGPGIRFVVFFQGCLHQCPGCHNPQSHQFELGTKTLISQIITLINQSPHLNGVTISGGDPFFQSEGLYYLVKAIKENNRFNNRNLDIVIYSGFSYQQLLEYNDFAKQTLELADYLVDGRYIDSLRDLSLLYRGSRNQNFIDLKTKKVLTENEIINL